jgi:hypothetical protein
MNARDYFERTDTITIVTGTKDGREIGTPVWGVVVDGVPYIRSAYGETSAWYRRVRRTGRASFGSGPRWTAGVELVDDEATRGAVDDAYRRKYRSQSEALRMVVEPPARDYTLRVVLDEAGTG